MTYIERSPSHDYTFDGVTYPGTTGILKVLDKSGPLVAWASKEAARAAVELFETDALGPLITSTGREGAIRAIANRREVTNERARVLGTNVHQAADDLVNGRPLPADLTAVERHRVEHYARWWETCGWVPRAIEARLVHTVKGYGGTLDLLCYDRDGRTVLADIKTGKGVYRETALQLAAYGAAEWLDQDDGNLYRMPLVDRYAVLHLTDEGLREVEMAVGPSEVAAFHACIELARWHAQQKGRQL